MHTSIFHSDLNNTHNVSGEVLSTINLYLENQPKSAPLYTESQSAGLVPNIRKRSIERLGFVGDTEV